MEGEDEFGDYTYFCLGLYQLVFMRPRGVSAGAPTKKVVAPPEATEAPTKRKASVAQVSTMTSKKPSNYWMMTLVWFGIF
jgi:hypothetical protein